MANQKSLEVLERMAALSVDIIKYCQNKALPRNVTEQLTRSITSVGANFSEAQDASSKRDFLNKIHIAKKEASESKYWLIIVEKLTPDSTEVRELSERTQKLVMMLQKIINTSRQRNRQSSIANSSSHR